MYDAAHRRPTVQMRSAKRRPAWRPQHELFKEVVSIPGVVSAVFDIYQIDLERGYVFEWEPIQDAVVRLLKTYEENGSG